jgi:hypothetical protein
MKNLRKLMAAILLAFALVAPIAAGDMSDPPAPPPPAANGAGTGDSENSARTTTGDIKPPSDPDVSTTTLLFELLYNVLSIY